MCDSACGQNSSMDSFLKAMENDNLQNDLFGPGANADDMSVTAAAILDWGQDNNLDISQAEAQSIIQSIDKNSGDGDQKLNLQELIFFKKSQ